MGTTTNFLLRYPGPTDAPNAPQQLSDLASDTDTALFNQKPKFARKTVTETLDSITFQDDNELQIAVEANKVYHVSIVLQYSGPSADDFKVQVLGPTGATFAGVAHGLAATAAAAASTDDLTVAVVMASELDFGTSDATVRAVHIEGLLVVSSTAGTFKVQWAKITNASSGVSVLPNSFMRVDPVS